MSFSSCIDDDDELLVTHIELTHQEECKIHDVMSLHRANHISVF